MNTECVFVKHSLNPYVANVPYQRRPPAIFLSTAAVQRWYWGRWGWGDRTGQHIKALIKDTPTFQIFVFGPLDLLIKVIKKK